MDLEGARCLERVQNQKQENQGNIQYSQALGFTSQV